MYRENRLNDIAERLSGSFDDYELFYLNEKERKVEARDGEICAVEVKEEEGYALRAVTDSRPVFAFTYDRKMPAEKLLSNTIDLLPVIEKDDDYIFPPRYALYSKLDLYDEKGLVASDDGKKGMLIDMEKKIREYDNRITAVRNCEFQEIELEAAIESSGGLSAYGRKTLFILSAMAVAKEGDDEVSWYDWCWSHKLEDINYGKFGLAVAEKVVSMLSAKQITTGAYEGILSPRAASDLLGILSESFLAENLFKNKTYLKDREGSVCFAEALTVVDSGMAGMDAFPFDGEGVPSTDSTVVENGVFRTFLYDSYFAKKLGKLSTGNSVRSGIKALPKCGVRGLFIQAGERNIQKIINNGIVIEELMGTHTANHVTGDFSVGALGYIYKNGSREPFQGVMFSGNVFDLFSNVKETGNDLVFYGSCGSPSLYIEGMKISGI